MLESEILFINYLVSSNGKFLEIIGKWNDFIMLVKVGALEHPVICSCTGTKYR